MVIQSEHAQAARALRAKLADLTRLIGERKEVRERMPNFAELAVMFQPQVEGDRLVLVLDEKDRRLDKALAILGRSIEIALEQTASARSKDNLMHIAIAMHGYDGENKHFPLPASTSPQGKPLLSWRVRILPFLGQDALYRQFHLDEPWDSPHNRTLIDKMPAVYCLPISKSAGGSDKLPLAGRKRGRIFRRAADEARGHQGRSLQDDHGRRGGRATRRDLDPAGGLAV